MAMEEIMNSVMQNPDVAAIGIAVGFLLKWALDMKKKRSRGMGGGFA